MPPSLPWGEKKKKKRCNQPRKETAAQHPGVQKEIGATSHLKRKDSGNGHKKLAQLPSGTHVYRSMLEPGNKNIHSSRGKRGKKQPTFQQSRKNSTNPVNHKRRGQKTRETRIEKSSNLSQKRERRKGDLTGRRLRGWKEGSDLQTESSFFRHTVRVPSREISNIMGKGTGFGAERGNYQIELDQDLRNGLKTKRTQGVGEVCSGNSLNMDKRGKNVRGAPD